VADARRWWRIEVGPSGKVVSCREVEDHDAGPNRATVFFVKARCQAEAGRRAWNEYCRLVQSRRRGELKAAGKCCWCARRNDRAPGKRCSRCLEAETARDRVHLAAARGELVELPNRAASIAARAEGERREIRLSVLGEVREAFERSQTLGQFAEWLARRLRDETPNAAKTGT
jgi:hypothetical protein